MSGIISVAGYLPYRRLDRGEISSLFGGAPGTGTRTVASYDEDTTTMGVEAARLALRSAPGHGPDEVWFSTVDPAYADRTNAGVVHAALRLDSSVPASDANGAARSAMACLRRALRSDDATLVVAADTRSGLPTGADESAGGDAAAAVLTGSGADVIAAPIGYGSATEEFVDRWRVPGERVSRSWEERFGETRYVPLAEQAWTAALKDAELVPNQVDRVIMTGLHTRAVRSAARRLGVDSSALVDDLSATVGNAGAAQPLLLLAAALETAAPNQTVALVSLADGADVIVVRTTDAVSGRSAARPVADQIDAGGHLPYGKFLDWTGAVTVQPPNRPAPDRPSSSVAARNEDWKYAFVGSKDRGSGAIHLPPQRVSMKGGTIDDMDPAPMADVAGSVVTFTVDRLVYSPSPPVVFAVVDFDGGGRMAIELTDVDADSVAIGDRVEMTFRRLFTSPDGIRNYFWKARPIRGGTS